MNGRKEGRLANHLRESERAFILDALRRHHGHNTDTARWLGLSRRSLYEKLRIHGLEGEASGLRAEYGIMGPRKVDLYGWKGAGAHTYH